MGVPSNNPSQAVQDALNTIETQYEAAMQYIDAMKGDAAKIQAAQQSEAVWLPKEHYTTCSAGVHVVNYHHHTSQTAINNYNAAAAKSVAAQADISAQRANMQKIFGPIFTNINATLATLLSMIHDIAFSGGPADLMASDFAAVDQMLSKLFEGMKQKATGAMYEAEMHSSVSGQLSTQQLEALSMECLQSQNAELSTMNGLLNTMNNFLTSYGTAYHNANIQSHSYDFWQQNFSLDGNIMAHDKEVMDNAKLMMNEIETVMHALAPEVASIMPEFTQVIDVIKKIIQEVKDLYANTKMNSGEKAGALLALVMYLLSFFQVVKQDVESEKAKNNQEMSSGTIQASKTNIDDTMMNQKIKQEMEHNAAVMKVTMIIMQVALGALMTIAVPGFGAGLLTAMVSAFETMQTAGVFDATGALAKIIPGGNSQIFADLAVTGMEMLLTMGGGALFDMAAGKIFAKAVETGVQLGLEIGEDLIEIGAEKAAQAAGKEGDEAAIEAASNTLTQVAQKTAPKAAKAAVQQFLKQPLGTQMWSVFTLAFKKEMAAAIKQAVQEAIGTAIEDSSTIAKLAAKGIESSEGIMDDIATNSASRSVSRISGKSVKNVASDMELAARSGKTAVIRGVWTMVYGIDANNLWTDIMKKAGVDEDAIGMILMQVVQLLLAMFAMMKGSGMLSATTMEGIASSIPRISGYLSVIPQAGEAAAAGATAETYDVESKAVTALAMNGSVADLLHSFLDQLQKDGNQDRDIMTKDIQQDAQSTQGLAGHLHDGDQAMVQVLVSAV